MALRLIEVILPTASTDRLRAALEEAETLGLWVSDLGENKAIARILVSTEWTETISDLLSDHLGLHPEFRLMLFTVEATLPLPKEEQQQTQAQQYEESGEEQKQTQPQRISREELYYDIAQGANLSAIYLLTVILSTVVAAVGLMRNDVAVIIGAMVIAPLLGPNVALALAATLGDLSLAAKGLKTLLAGVVTALLLAVVIGFITPVDPQGTEIAARTQLDAGHILLALAAGSAGALAFTGGGPATVIGVMVAVALLPPLAVAGLLVGAGYNDLALNALLLFLTNVACINIAGVITFLSRKIRPRTWWESERAGRAMGIAMAIWLTTQCP
jgi:uncharacterized hydrophobic protein (TIGR00341 family)